MIGLIEIGRGKPATAMGRRARRGENWALECQGGNDKRVPEEVIGLT